MKRKSSVMAATAAPAADAEERAETKKARRDGQSGTGDEAVGLENNIDVQGFLERDCEISSKKLIDQAKARAAEMRHEFEKGKKALLAGLEAEKENLHSEEDNGVPLAYSVTVKCVHGPYEGTEFTMTIDAKHHSSCYVGRSTGRKFRPPHGISLPKDAELSTTHAQIKLEKDGRLLFTDLDSTNGSTVNDDEVLPNEPYALNAHKPIKLAVGSSELLLTFAPNA